MAQILKKPLDPPGTGYDRRWNLFYESKYKDDSVNYSYSQKQNKSKTKSEEKNEVKVKTETYKKY